MIDLRDGFLREIDDQTVGISKHISNYTQILSIIEPKLLKVIELNNVNH